MTQPPEIRRAETRDVAALVRLRAEMFTAMGADASGTAWQANAAAWFHDRLEHEDYLLVVVAVGGEVVSCAVGVVRDALPSPGAPEARDALIGSVCTDPQHRRQGYAEAALSAVMDWARGLGVGRAELLATAGGRGMYERAGFTETPYPAMRARLDP